MKKQNTTTVAEPAIVEETPVKKTWTKRHTLFLLFCKDTKTFVSQTDNNPPVLDNTNPMTFDSRSDAVYARDFFVNVLKMAESISVLGVVA